MATPALLIAFDPTLKKFLVRRIPMDGFPAAMKPDLDHLTTLEQALNPQPFLPQRYQRYDWKPWIFNTVGNSAEFDDLCEIAEYLYRFNLADHHWYIWSNDLATWIDLNLYNQPSPFIEDN